MGSIIIIIIIIVVHWSTKAINSYSNGFQRPSFSNVIWMIKFLVILSNGKFAEMKMCINRNGLHCGLMSFSPFSHSANEQKPSRDHLRNTDETEYGIESVARQIYVILP